MKKFLYVLLFVSSLAYAGDVHYADESHRVEYNIVDINGKPVAGQTVNIAVERSKDNAFLDFNDRTFKTSGWTTRMSTMNYDATGEHYYSVITIDQAVIVSGEYCSIISNDDSTYVDHAIECWSVSNLNKLIKANR